MTNNPTKIDIAIVGGGIVGLWSAYFILKKFPLLSVVVFESENFLGEHTTGRNSEVLHSGIYYPTNSLKHLHCLAGNQLWRDYIKQKNMSFLDCGKIIAASSKQDENLENLFKHSKVNGVSGIRWLTRPELGALKDIIRVDNGFFSPSSGVLNVSEGLSFLRQDIEAMGGIVLTKSLVSLSEYSHECFLLNINADHILASSLINTAGLFAVDFRKNLGLQDFENFYVKGNYLKLKKKINADTLIYPIPPIDSLGLGVHLTIDTAGEQKFGPDTEIIGTIDYSMEPTLIDKMIPSIRQIFKNINEADLQLAYAGIRPKVKKEGAIVPDFVFNSFAQHGIKGYFEFLGIESPGITASPSLALMLSNAL